MWQHQVHLRLPYVQSHACVSVDLVLMIAILCVEEKGHMLAGSCWKVWPEDLSMATTVGSHAAVTPEGCLRASTLVGYVHVSGCHDDVHQISLHAICTCMPMYMHWQGQHKSSCISQKHFWNQ